MHAEDILDPEYIEGELRGLERPAFVRNVRVSGGEDASGDEALWVWLIVEEGSVAQAERKESLKAFESAIRSRLAACAPGVWPYIRLDNP